MVKAPTKLGQTRFRKGKWFIAHRGKSGRLIWGKPRAKRTIRGKAVRKARASAKKRGVKSVRRAMKMDRMRTAKRVFSLGKYRSSGTDMAGVRDRRRKRYNRKNRLV